MNSLAEIITIGDEILYGQTLDTNSHWISQKLDEAGIKVLYKTTIGDREDHILKAIREAESRVSIILITGGLGPTKDDLTKPCLVNYFNTRLVFNQEAYQELEALFSKVNRKLTDLNKQQAYLPENCEKISNKMGTAPGMWFEQKGKVYVSMPGVPYEMKNMMNESIIPRLREKFVDQMIFHRMIRTIGIPESTLAQLIEEWENALPSHIKLAYLPTLGAVKLRLTAIGQDQKKLETEVNQQISNILPTISKYVYGYDEEEIEEVVGKTLVESNQSISCAESCTGGYLSHLLTSIPGSSRYFKGSIIAYSNEIKEKKIGVSKDKIEQFGAVSEEVVLEMAKNIREKMGSDVGLAVSGIAGPGGGTEEKPVGTVWIGYSDRSKTIARKYNFSKNRSLNIQFSAYSALNMFRLNFSGS